MNELAVLLLSTSRTPSRALRPEYEPHSTDNKYFAQVMANRVWADLMGRGLVEPIDDLRAGAAYRLDQVEIMMTRALSTLARSEQAQALADPFPVLAGIAIVTQFQIVMKRATRQGIEPRLVSTLLGWAIFIGLVSAHVFDMVLYEPAKILEDGLREVGNRATERSA